MNKKLLIILLLFSSCTSYEPIKEEITSEGACTTIIYTSKSGDKIKRFCYDSYAVRWVETPSGEIKAITIH